RGRVAGWRRSNTGPLPIPETLWTAAAEVAREHGVFRTAKVLSLEYGKLRRLTTESHRERVRTARLSCGSRRDSSSATDAHSGSHRVRRSEEGHRWAGAVVPRKTGRRSVLRMPVHFSQPKRPGDSGV